MTNLNELQWYWRFLIFSGIIAWCCLTVWAYWIIKVKISNNRKNRKKHDHDAEMLRIINKNLRSDE